MWPFVPVVVLDEAFVYSAIALDGCEHLLWRQISSDFIRARNFFMINEVLRMHVHEGYCA